MTEEAKHHGSTLADQPITLMFSITHTNDIQYCRSSSQRTRSNSFIPAFAKYYCA